MTAAQMRSLMLGHRISVGDLMHRKDCPIAPVAVARYYAGKPRTRLPDAFVHFLLEVVDERKDPAG